ncbi:MAG: tetratricopeptide repeat protein [Candidatus Micrarchaeia archaeon]
MPKPKSINRTYYRIKTMGTDYDEIEEGLLSRFTTLYEDGKYEEALECINELIRLKPDHGIGWFLKGRLLCEMGRFEIAEPCLRRAVELEPNRIEPLLNLAYAYMGLGNIEEAISVLERANALYPNDIDVLMLTALCYAILEDEEKTREYWEKALKINPKEAAEFAQEYFEKGILPSDDIPAEEKIELQKMLNEIMAKVAVLTKKPNA